MTPTPRTVLWQQAQYHEATGVAQGYPGLGEAILGSLKPRYLPPGPQPPASGEELNKV